MSTPPFLRRKRRYYDELALKFPEFATVNFPSFQVGDRPNTSYWNQRRGTISSIRQKQIPSSPQNATRTDDEKNRIERAKTPVRTTIKVKPILPMTPTNENRRKVVVIKEKRPKVVRISRIKLKKMEYEAKQEEDPIPIINVDNNNDEKDNVMPILDSTRSSSSNNSLFLNDSNSNSNSISSTRSSSSIDIVNKSELNENVQNIEMDDDGLPYIPPLDLSVLHQFNDFQEQYIPSFSPYTFTNEILKLNDQDFEQLIDEDTLFLKSILIGNRWNKDNLYSFITSLTDQQYSIVNYTYLNQAMKLARLSHLIKSLMTLDTVQTIAQRIEKELQSIFNVPTVVVWINIESAKNLINYSRLLRYPQGVGFVGTCASKKIEIVAPNPTMSSIYSEEYDLPFCEDVNLINCQPILDSKNELIGVILLIDKIHPSGASYAYWPPSEAYLLRYFCSNLFRVFRKFHDQNNYTSRIYDILANFISKVHDPISLFSSINSHVTQNLNCNSLTIFLKDENNEEKLSRISVKNNAVCIHSINIHKHDILQPIFQNGQVLNVAFTDKDDSSDNRFNSSVLGVPLYTNGKMTGAFVVRGKKGSPCFVSRDVKLLENFAIIASPTISSSLIIRKQTLELRNALSTQDKLAQLLYTAESFAKETNTDHLLETISETSKSMVDADRVSLFVVDDTRTQLYTKVANGIKPLLIPINCGLVGATAKLKRVINIEDAYKDLRFDQRIDSKTGYRTKSLMTVPVINQLGQLVAVMELINKTSADVFSENDVQLCQAMCVFAGIALTNSKIIDRVLNTSQRISGMISTVRILNSGEALSSVVHTILNTVRNLIQADKCALFLVDKNKLTLSSTFTEGELSSIVVSFGKGIIGHVAETGESVNIPDAYKDKHFHSGTDETSNYRTRSVLASPLKDFNGNVTGVLEMINKDVTINGGVFSQSDQQLLNSFTSLLGFAYNRYESRQSGHAIAVYLSNLLSSDQELSCEPPSSLLFSLEQINSINFRARQQYDQMRVLFSIFHYSEMCSLFRIQNCKLVKFLLSVMDLYQQSKIFTFDKAVKSAHFIFYAIMSTELGEMLSYIEKFALIIAALCHNIGHNDENEGDQMRIALSILFRNQAPLEVYHCEQTVALITKEDSCIIDHLTSNERNNFFQILFDIILGTDPAKHFSLIQSAICLVRPLNLFNKNVSSHRFTLMKLLIKASDVYESFQSLEKAAESNTSILNPILSKRNRLNNIGFALFISRPIMSILVDILPLIKPYLDSIEKSINQWKE